MVGSWGGVGCDEGREEDDLQAVDTFGARDGRESARGVEGLREAHVEGVPVGSGRRTSGSAAMGP